MKATRISEHIWSLKSWFLFPVHVWVVVGSDGVTLVDAGFPFMAKGIRQFIDQLGAGPLQRILLTHGHGDHIGAIKTILTRSPVPLHAHRTEIPYMVGERPYPRRKWLEHNVARGLAQPLAEDGEGHLAEVAGMKPYLTPGHSPGHVAYYHEQDRVLLAGDLFTSSAGKLRPPMRMFTADMAEAVRSGAIVGQLNPQLVAVCHGEPVLNPAAQLDQYLRAI
jgi:glyoxylase-like metal-dependent hydrolase (beta-lactamase superfamily II)